MHPDVRSYLAEGRQACAEGRTADAEAILEQLRNDDTVHENYWAVEEWFLLQLLGRDAEALERVSIFYDPEVPYQMASWLSYHTFDPAPFPELVALLEQEGATRPPPADFPFKCPPPEGDSIAVLPFRDMSPEGDQGWFAEGMAEELLNALVRVEGLEVASRTSSFAYADQNLEAQDIGQRLEVNHILEGSIRTAGERIRVTAQLIDVASDKHLWSEVYDRQLDDVFGIQDEITTAIVTALDERLGEREVPEIAHARDIDAYSTFLKGRHALIRRDHKAALRLLREAVKPRPPSMRRPGPIWP